MYKHAVAKNKVAKKTNTGKVVYNGGFRKKQKKPSHIKKMKELYEKIYASNLGHVVADGGEQQKAGSKGEEQKAVDGEECDENYIT